MKQTIHLSLQGLNCAGCVASVEKACRNAKGVSQVQVNLAEQSATVIMTDANPTMIDALLQTIQTAGYKASVMQSEEDKQKELNTKSKKEQAKHKRNAIIALIVGAPLMLWGIGGGNMMIRNSGDQITWLVVGLVCLVVLCTAGQGFYRSAWNSLKHKRATMDTLVALGTGAAWFYSILVCLFPEWFPVASRHVYFEASAMIIGLISLGHFIEAKAKLKTTHSLLALIGLQSTEATLVTKDGEQTVPVSEIKTGMQIRIKPGEKIPVDGTVISGESYVDEAMLTGEPLPKLKSADSKITAGTINNDGTLLAKASSVGHHTTLARIIRMVREAQSSKPDIARLADRISAVFVPVVVGIAILSAAIWWLIGPEPQASYMLVVSTTVLIIACPCALGLATPLSVTVGIGKAAEMGILIKNAGVLQTAEKIDTVVFDKTGTLTQGKPTVSAFHKLSDIDEPALLSLILSVESLSEHPLAKAICQYAKENGAESTEVKHFTNYRGKGIQAEVNGNKILIGSPTFIQKNSSISPQQLPDLTPLNGLTQVLVSIEGQISAGIGISDPIKKEALEAVNRLKERGINVVLLTGDNKAAAHKIADNLNINNVIANVLPEEKARHIQDIQNSGKKVAMVGDGINDAPALAQADIGIAMGSGSDVAIESAQMTILNSSPIAVFDAIELSKATVRNIKQNLFGAFIYNTLGIPIAAGVLYPISGFLLNPVIGGAAMALSSITVVTNANRLRLFDAQHSLRQEHK